MGPKALGTQAEAGWGLAGLLTAPKHHLRCHCIKRVPQCPAAQPERCHGIHRTDQQLNRGWAGSGLGLVAQEVGDDGVQQRAVEHLQEAGV